MSNIPSETYSQKTHLDFIQAHSLRGLMTQVNSHNSQNPEYPILKEDIVEILKEEDTFILLYYK